MVVAPSLLVLGDSFANGGGDYPALLDLPGWAIHTDAVGGRTMVVGLTLYAAAYAAAATPPSISLIELGINDAVGGANLGGMKASARSFISMALAADPFMGVMLTTVSPFGLSASYTGERESVRLAYNAWVRNLVTNGHRLFLFDLDEVMRDPANHANVLAAYDFGDGLHPNDTGMAAIAAELDVLLPSAHGECQSVIACYGSE